jgi:hypothetical protein
MRIATAAPGETSTKRPVTRIAAAAATVSASPARTPRDARARASSFTCKASMITAAIGTTANTYCSDIPMDGERWLAIAGTRAAPCHARRPQNPATSAVTACRSTARTPSGRRVTRLSTPRWDARPIATHAPRNEAQMKRYRQSSSLHGGVSFSTYRAKTCTLTSTVMAPMRSPATTSSSRHGAEAVTIYWPAFTIASSRSVAL